MLKHFIASAIPAVGVVFFIGLAIHYDPNTSTFITPSSVSKRHYDYMEKNQPQLRIFYESISFQIVQCNESLKRLKSLKQILTADNSERLVMAKQNQILSQKQKLSLLLERINLEVETGMINQEFNSLDQGGIRQEHIEEIIKDCKNAINQAENLNKYVSKLQK